MVEQPLSPTRFTEDFESNHRYVPEGHAPIATASAAGASEQPSRIGTLKKKNSLKKKESLKRSGSRRSRAGSTHSVRSGASENRSSLYYTPIPTKGNPTEVLVIRFSAWRKVLKDFITYFSEVQAQYQARSRSIAKLSATLNQAADPIEFAPRGGIFETHNVLRDFHKEANSHSESAARIETEVIAYLSSVRSDLALKIKEIKALSGDFKNNVDKEKETAKKELARFQEVLENRDSIAHSKDPYLSKLAFERQLRRYLAEENYLHKAYLNLEASGRALEKIVVGEIQKAYNVYVRILTREGQEILDVAERLTMSTLRLPQDYEWSEFLERDSAMVDPSVALRSFEEIEYPGCREPAVLEVRSGALERKSKYLKSFTAAWYVLSPTHLHEFKSPDRIRDQTPVMSLYLPDAKLGKHSDPAAISHKFVLKARQTGSLHRGHSWVFRAESHEEMLAWYETIKKLTEASAAERDAYVADVTSASTKHRRGMSTGSHGDDSDGLENDEADAVPYSGCASTADDQLYEYPPPISRPEGGRFPSDIQISRNDSVSGDSSWSAVAAAAALPGMSEPPNIVPMPAQNDGETLRARQTEEEVPAHHSMDQSYIVASPHHHRKHSGSVSECHDDQNDAIKAIPGGVNNIPVLDEQRIPVPDDQNAHATQNSSYPTPEDSARAEGASLAPDQEYEREPKPDAKNSATRPTAHEIIVTSAEKQTPIKPTVVSATDGGHVIDLDAAPIGDAPAMTTTPIPARPDSHRAGSKTTVNTISDLHIPGEYPNQRPQRLK